MNERWNMTAANRIAQLQEADNSALRQHDIEKALYDVEKLMAKALRKLGSDLSELPQSTKASIELDTSSGKAIVSIVVATSSRQSDELQTKFQVNF